MEAKAMRWPMVLPAAVLLLAMLACGGFQVRVTPTPKPSPQAKVQPTTAPTVTPAPTAKPTIARTVTVTPTLAAPTSVPNMAVGGKARVTAAGGVNVRDKASAKGKQVGRLNLDAVVALLEGPLQADNYAWWRIDNGSGLTGWVATGPTNDPWLVPSAGASAAPQPAGAPKLVDRAIKLGDRVQVTTAPGQPLTVRDAAGKTATAMAKVLPGTLFTVRGGPVKQDGLTWWELEGDAVKGWAAEGDGVDRWLAPVE